MSNDITLPRRFIGKAMMVSAAALVAGCATNPNNPPNPPNPQDIINQVISDAAAFVTELENVLPSLKNLISANAYAQIQTWLGDLKNLVNSLQNVTTLPSASTIVKEIETIVNDIVSFAATLSVIPQPFQLALQLAALLLPVIENLIGLIPFPTPAPAQMSPAMARLLSTAPKLTPSQIRAKLALLIMNK